MAFVPSSDTLAINTDLARRILTGFIRDEMAVVGFNRAVIGLSGGIDSALVAYLAAEALGAENVLCIRMPYKSSNPESLEHAGLVIDALGVPNLTVEITDMVDPLIERFPDMNAMRRGNIMVRQRMIILFDQSAAFNGLVLGTSNKTESLLGYSTIFGDSAAALQPIADLYKHQVRQLSRAVGVPAPIVDKPPSADLWPGQTDEGELGYTYDQADQLLYLLVDERYTLDEAVEAGFAREFVDRVWRTVRGVQFKRQMPVIAKLSRRTIGVDFLYLRDWGWRTPF
ncbi:MAG: NAD+ synthase [Anaerolineae bacterium]|nr:NAD+ synthase [Anaerolineae bacterium]